jgi:hypothetical protein
MNSSMAAIAPAIASSSSLLLWAIADEQSKRPREKMVVVESE